MKTIVKLVLFASALTLPVRALCSSPRVARAFAGTRGDVQTDDGVYAARGLPLEERRRFWHGDRGPIVRNYQAATCAAAEVLERHAPRTLYAALARLPQGARFDDVFGPGPTHPR